MPLNSNEFNDFNYDEETFGEYAEHTGWNDDETSRATIFHYPFTLPDEPLATARQHGQYHGTKTSRFLREGDASSSQPPTDPPIDPCTKEQWSYMMRRWPTATTSLNEGYLSDRAKYRPLYKWDDRYSVPCPPPGRGHPDPLPQLVGFADPTTPFMNVRPTMITLPKAFHGGHDDIEQFFGDCQMYFEAHASYFLLLSHMIPFATSLFDRPTKVWWVYKHNEYWSQNDSDMVYPRFRYPTWVEFVNLVNTQF
ncbi:uncharacterized protein ARMOST_16972 [Armillaria ostoyae]|uniref:Uncharacterized protein n=1 Tax=Armillaria ostoyae TaxID=47428 RepID=A0A284RXP2_ARMOS|nr:uncharacterized protein ARMOST_16972 [Armillaria ostoyae]